MRNLPCSAASAHDNSDSHGGNSAHSRRLAEASTNTTHSGKCGTDVIGDVTPFKFSSPYPFFLNDDYYVNGTYTLGPEQAGTVMIQGGLLAIAGVVQGLMTTEVVTSFVKTPPHTPSIVWSMGAANLISGFLGGMVRTPPHCPTTPQRPTPASSTCRDARSRHPAPTPSIEADTLRGACACGRAETR